MSKHNCFECGESVTLKDKHCPKCNVKNPFKKPTPKWMKIFNGICFVIIGLVCLAVFFAKQEEAEKAAQRPPEFTLTTEQMSNEFKMNAFGAESKYMDKKIRITGEADTIGKNVFGNVFITMQGVWGGKSFYANVAEEYESRAAQLQAGQQVTLICDVTDSLFEIQLENCVV